MPKDVVGDIERSAATMKLIVQPLIVLSLLEIRQHIVVAPADVAEVAPPLVVAAMSADVNHVINGTGAAERSAARPGKAPQIAMQLWNGAESPIEFGIQQHPHHRRSVD